MISAFGARAERFAQGLGELAAVIADPSMLGQAYLEAIRRRERGEAFYTMVLYEEPRAQTTLAHASYVLAQIAGIDERRAALNQLAAGTLLLGSRAAAELWTAPAATVQIVNEFLSLGNGTLVRSFAEAERLNAVSARPRTIEPVLSEPALPAARPRSGGAPGVVIWAPHDVPAFAGWYAFALAEFFGDVTCVTAAGDIPPGLPARFITAAHPALAEVLSGAQCVVCTDPDDPGPAVAFARAGFGVAAPYASGAHEFARDVAGFGFARTREVELAVKIAIWRPASVRFVPQPPAVPDVPALLSPAEALPLVTVVVPTYNRPGDLAQCMRDLARQTYPNLDILVVNDAGENVDHVVAPYPNVRIVNLPMNGGVERLVVEALKLVRGSYIQLLADDDALFPDHIERLMAAILRSGAQIAHGNTLIRYQQRSPGGELSVTGYNAIVFRDSTTASEALISTPIAGQSLIIHRDTVDASGGYSDRTMLGDQEFQLRLAGRYVFAYVDEMTNEWRVREGENRSARTDGAAELRRVYEEFHPRPDRPLIEQERRQALDAIAARPKGFIFEPTIRLKRPAGS